MSTEEPAWKAELKSAVLNAVIDSEQFRGVQWTPTTDAVMAAVETHIQAAEERGRREALREAAQKLRDRQTLPPLSVEEEAFNDMLSGAADLIDPDKEKA